MDTYFREMRGFPIAQLAAIRRSEDMVPFLDQWLAVDEAEFQPLPDDMLAILKSSEDFISIVPGAPPTWVQLETDAASAELVIYRAGTGACYVLARRRPDRNGGLEAGRPVHLD